MKIFCSTIIKKKNVRTIRNEDGNLVLTNVGPFFLIQPVCHYFWPIKLLGKVGKWTLWLHSCNEYIPIFVGAFCQLFGKRIFQRCQHISQFMNISNTVNILSQFKHTPQHLIMLPFLVLSATFTDLLIKGYVFPLALLLVLSTSVNADYTHA